jgi:hypothetical protein
MGALEPHKGRRAVASVYDPPLAYLGPALGVGTRIVPCGTSRTSRTTRG